MGVADDISEARQHHRNGVAIDLAAWALASLDSPDGKAVWRRHFLGPDCLPWQCTREFLSQGPSETERKSFRSAGERLLGMGESEKRRRRNSVSELYGPFAAAMLKGMVRSIQAATTLTERARYEEGAAEAYGEAFQALGDPTLGPTVAADVIDRLAGEPEDWAVTTTILLDDFRNGKYIRAGTVMVVGEAGLLPDPLGLGLTNLDDTFLNALGHIWQFM